MKESIKEEKGGASGMKRQRLFGIDSVDQNFAIFENKGHGDPSKT